MLAAARYGHPDIVRDLVNDFGCNKEAVKQVSLRSAPEQARHSVFAFDVKICSSMCAKSLLHP